MTLSAELEPTPPKIDPRICGECGLTIDRHRRVDALEGPEFYCDDLERQIYLDACALRVSWEMADSRDRWRYTGEAPPAPKVSDTPDASKRRPKPYRPADSTVDAFLYVVRLDDADYLRRWLARHPLDAPHLLEIWERKNAVA
jgi:hypothetical protein